MSTLDLENRGLLKTCNSNTQLLVFPAVLCEGTWYWWDSAQSPVTGRDKIFSELMWCSTEFGMGGTTEVYFSLLTCLFFWECQFSLCISSYKLIKFLGVKDDCSVFWLTTGMEQLWHKLSGGIILGVTYLLENLKNTVSAWLKCFLMEVVGCGSWKIWLLFWICLVLKYNQDNKLHLTRQQIYPHTSVYQTWVLCSR